MGLWRNDDHIKVIVWLLCGEIVAAVSQVLDFSIESAIMAITMEEFIDLSTLFDPCVYVLMQGSQVIYVGQATNVYSRLQAHRNSRRLRWDRLLIRPCAQHDLLRLEAHYITKLKPIMNKQRPMPWPDKRIDLVALGMKIRTMKRRIV